MSIKILSVVENGFDGIVAEIECHITNGLPAIIIVGFANKAVDEAKERIRSAFASCAIPFPKKRITINLAPADIPKENASFDLAIATAILSSNKSIANTSGDVTLFGELGLDGSVKPARGIIGRLLCAQNAGHTTAFVPAANAQQASIVTGMTLYPVSSLKDLYAHLTGQQPLIPIRVAPLAQPTRSSHQQDFSDIVGQSQAKRALTIAAAGGHNVLLGGPPGTGKSMLAKALPTILPPMTQEEIIETTHLHSLGNRNYETLITERPFRSPHHSASDTAIIGGGRNPKPGEISLSHNGILFFDELPEFKRTTVEALRQPLEDNIITVSRAKDTLRFPANFILVATANPCPCGYFGTHRQCSCMPSQIQNYQRKLSGPILDRIDLYVNVENVDHQKLLETNSDKSDTTSGKLKKIVTQARDRQKKRFNRSITNATMNNRDIKKHVQLAPAARALLDAAATKLELSPRAYMRTLKVAQTIADIDDTSQINQAQIAEALQYRPQLKEL